MSRSCRPCRTAQRRPCAAAPRRAASQAGYAIKGGKRVARTVSASASSFYRKPTFQPHHMPFIENFNTLGIDATIPIVDPVQMENRRNDFDYEVVIERFGFRPRRNLLRSFFSSQAGSLKGSQNLAGIADPAIDAMIQKVIAANSRPELVTACRALDRLIRAGRYSIPHWYKASIGSLIGTFSAVPRPNRATPGGSWKPGGMTPRRPPGLSRGAKEALAVPPSVRHPSDRGSPPSTG